MCRAVATASYLADGQINDSVRKLLTIIVGTALLTRRYTLSLLLLLLLLMGVF